MMEGPGTAATTGTADPGTRRGFDDVASGLMQPSTGPIGNAQRTVDGATAQGEAAGGNQPSFDSTGQGQVTPSVVDRVVGPYRAVMKFLGRRTLARVTLAVPRTLRFMHTTAMGGDVSDDEPTPSLSVGLVAGVAMDEALLAMVMAPSRFPRRADFA